jgi:hypothetical protein
LQCCLVTDGGGALILVAAERARDFPQSLPVAANRGPVYLLGTSETVETPMVSPPVIPAKAGIQDRQDFSRPLDPRFRGGDDNPCRAARPAPSSPGNTAPGGKLPLNTNGGGLSYMHSGMYSIYALQESVRQCAGSPRPDPRRQNLGLPRRRRHVRRLRHHHHVERATVNVGMRLGSYQSGRSPNSGTGK